MDKDRLALVKDLREKGLSFKEIGSRIGVSKQRVYSILNPTPRKGRVWLSENRKFVLDILKGGPMARSELVDIGAVGSAIDSLCAKGLIVEVGRKRARGLRGRNLRLLGLLEGVCLLGI